MQAGGARPLDYSRKLFALPLQAGGRAPPGPGHSTAASIALLHFALGRGAQTLADRQPEPGVGTDDFLNFPGRNTGPSASVSANISLACSV